MGRVPGKGGIGGECRKNLSKHLRQPTRVTVADAFPNTKQRHGVKLQAIPFPDRTHGVVTERYFAKCLESSGPIVSEGNGMPTVQNLCKVQRIVG